MTTQTNFNAENARLVKRIDELEIRTLYLEDMVEGLNKQLADITQEFILAKDAMRLLHQRLLQVQSDQPSVKDFSEETPPPHY